MRITYDTETDALTLVVTRESVDKTVDAGEGRFIDLDDDGQIVAVEILDVSQGFHLHDLMDRFDLKPLLDDFAEHVQTARSLLSEGDLHDALLR